jgi:hypothetical protein
LGGGGLLKIYEGSLPLILTSVYPNYDWLMWRFERCPKDFWEKVENQRKFVNWAADQLKITNQSDWYSITEKVIFLK